MEGSVSRQSLKQNLQTGDKCGLQKDLWFLTREGSLSDVESALTFLKKNGGNINVRNMLGLTPLHIATWRNHVPIVKRLLAAGADPNARDGESGWSSLHRALHFGHLAVASILLQSGASISLEDSKSRTPIDLLSGPVMQVVGNENTTELFSWGSGANYQLGTGNAHIQKLPCKVDSLQGTLIKLISAAKFHSVAVSSSGEVYTWGFGRGGRLGHSEFDIHSGQAAVITPRKVISGLSSHRVKAIAAAKHHTVIATESGEVFTWGSNREGQLGYTSVDTQPTPRRVSSLRARITAVAAANKHTSVVSEAGEVFTWGCNREGQLGYGTSNSASNYTPRVVEYLKGKALKSVTAAKFHTIVLGADGEVFTWGHRLVTPKRVIIARNLKKCGSFPLKFHRMEKLHVVAVSAGVVHSMALTEDGALFYWASSDTDLRCQQLYSVSGKRMVCIAAGKYWAAAVTDRGDVYMWDGKKGTDEPPFPTRLPGVKKATSVSVGETHLLIVGSLYNPVYFPNIVADQPAILKLEGTNELEELDGDFMFKDEDRSQTLPQVQKDGAKSGSVPSLMSLCEKIAATFVVEPRNALQLLEVAESLEADNLKKHCEEIVIRNLDYIFTVSGQAVANTSLDILASLERLLDSRSSELWSCRQLPTPTATFPAIIYSEDDGGDSPTRGSHLKWRAASKDDDRKIDCFIPMDDTSHVCKQIRALRKKLQQIEMLEARQSMGQSLDEQQIAKLGTKFTVESLLDELGVPANMDEGEVLCSISSDAKLNKKAKMSRKQKSKKKVPHHGSVCGNSEELNSPVLNKDKARDLEFEALVIKPDDGKASGLHSPQKNTLNSSKNRTTASKKNKKGGLSMFLSGALDDSPTKAASCPVLIPKREGPAWGGAKISKGSASLREILDEESKMKHGPQTRKADQAEKLSDGDRSVERSPKNSFLPTNPIPEAGTRTASRAPDGDKGTPPWGPSGTPPFHSRPSLRDIQMQQQGKQQPQGLSQSPMTQALGFSISTGQGSPLDSAVLNRWFKPEGDTPSALRSIQIEEKAMKDLKRFYSSVKVVKNPS